MPLGPPGSWDGKIRYATAQTQGPKGLGVQWAHKNGTSTLPLDLNLVWWSLFKRVNQMYFWIYSNSRALCWVVGMRSASERVVLALGRICRRWMCEYEYYVSPMPGKGKKHHCRASSSLLVDILNFITHHQSIVAGWVGKAVTVHCKRWQRRHWVADDRAAGVNTASGWNTRR